MGACKQLCHKAIRRRGYNSLQELVWIMDPSNYTTFLSLQKKWIVLLIILTVFKNFNKYPFSNMLIDSSQMTAFFTESNRERKNICLVYFHVFCIIFVNVSQRAF